MENNQLSDFLKYAYEHNSIRPLSEAFEEFNPEEEWHKGKIELVLNEELENYEEYEIGDIVFVKDFYYKNGKEGTNHFFVIIDKNNLAVPVENFGMLISSKINKLLKADNKNKLNRDSIVKTDVIYLIKNSDILFKLGSVDLDKIEEYKNNYLNR